MEKRCFLGCTMESQTSFIWFVVPSRRQCCCAGKGSREWCRLYFMRFLSSFFRQNKHFAFYPGVLIQSGHFQMNLKAYGGSKWDAVFVCNSVSERAGQKRRPSRRRNRAVSRAILSNKIFCNGIGKRNMLFCSRKRET